MCLGSDCKAKHFGPSLHFATLFSAEVPCGAMKPPHLLVPKEIAKSPKEVAKYAEILEYCVKNAFSPKKADANEAF
jgi:hypothetical protein